jgi:hypothetical protein
VAQNKAFRDKNPGYHCNRITKTPESYLRQLWYFTRYRKHVCTILPDDLFDLWRAQHGECAVTGKPMTHERVKGQDILTNVSIDRVDNSIGYVKSNVRLVCKAVNKMKSDMTNEDFMKWCGFVSLKSVT